MVCTLQLTLSFYYSFFKDDVLQDYFISKRNKITETNEDEDINEPDGMEIYLCCEF